MLVEKGENPNLQRIVQRDLGRSCRSVEHRVLSEEMTGLHFAVSALAIAVLGWAPLKPSAPKTPIAVLAVVRTGDGGSFGVGVDHVILKNGLVVVRRWKTRNPALPDCFSLNPDQLSSVEELVQSLWRAKKPQPSAYASRQTHEIYRTVMAPEPDDPDRWKTWSANGDRPADGPVLGLISALYRFESATQSREYRTQYVYLRLLQLDERESGAQALPSEWRGRLVPILRCSYLLRLPGAEAERAHALAYSAGRDPILEDGDRQFLANYYYYLPREKSWSYQRDPPCLR